MPFFLMRCVHHSGMDEKRDSVRPDHRKWVGSGGNGLASVLIGSAVKDETGANIGNFGILEARSLDDARAFAEGDLFNTAGVVRDIDLAQLPDNFQADRITNPMSPRLSH